MSVDHVYWTFSSAAQSISAFVAFVLTGYALVHNMMESARQRDDTLDDVHSALSKSYHLQLSILMWLTGFAIILNLILVYNTRTENDPSALWIAIAMFFDAISIILGINFVVQIVNPEKYKNAAKAELKGIVDENFEKLRPVADFFSAFVELEKFVRDCAQSSNIKYNYRNQYNSSVSFRQMIDVLLQAELVDSVLYNELQTINKYRNLVFHGHVESADSDMIRRVKDALSKIQKNVRKVPEQGPVTLTERNDPVG